jgi:hypothetical protein
VRRARDRGKTGVFDKLDAGIRVSCRFPYHARAGATLSIRLEGQAAGKILGFDDPGNVPDGSVNFGSSTATSTFPLPAILDMRATAAISPSHCSGE